MPGHFQDATSPGPPDIVAGSLEQRPHDTELTTVGSGVTVFAFEI